MRANREFLEDVERALRSFAEKYQHVRPNIGELKTCIGTNCQRCRLNRLADEAGERQFRDPPD